MKAVSIDRALLVSDDRKEFIQHANGKEFALRLITEARCSKNEYDQALIMAHLKSPYIRLHIHGRRKNKTVELFRNNNGEETPRLRQQLQEQGYNVTTRNFPINLEEERHLLIQDALATKILPTRNADIEHGILAGRKDSGTLVIVTTNLTQWRMIYMSCIMSDELPSIAEGKLVFLGTIRANYIQIFADDDACDPFFKKERHVDIQIADDVPSANEMVSSAVDGIDLVETIDGKESGGVKRKTKRGKADVKRREYQARLKAKKRAERVSSAADSGGRVVEGGGEGRLVLPDGRRVEPAEVKVRFISLLVSHPEVMDRSYRR